MIPPNMHAFPLTKRTVHIPLIFGSNCQSLLTVLQVHPIIKEGKLSFKEMAATAAPGRSITYNCHAKVILSQERDSAAVIFR